ncbi:MAG: nicotinate-nucleotide--dimethylbenzimidazole phosphoribosyltransferase [Oribacterium sp.]|nr:nicotinate-nucleotide--dimethylbenzimidazole phosphoribosyltransferase [Oribacterium sp.]MBP3803353.1 nicotinate-nucleotide--dimethylbenzimidazole phosphoribosyltransferase [Oribacterium sp.]
MKYSIVIAADKSGSGKTTVTCGLISVLKKRGLKVQSFKCGPDYIDPMFHREVLGVPSGNLDSFFVSGEMLRRLYAERAGNADVSVIEGVMGYYDGLGGVSAEGSTWEITDIIGSPAILVMDCKGASVSVAALIRGMLDFADHIGLGGTDEKVIREERFSGRETLRDDEKYSKDDSEKTSEDSVTEQNRRNTSVIRGVILNRVSPVFYERLKGVIEEACPELKVLGYLPDMPEMQVPSRHLGLIEPEDMESFSRWAETVSEQLEKTVDIDGILELAETCISGEAVVASNLNHKEDFSKSAQGKCEKDIRDISEEANRSEYKSAPVYTSGDSRTMKVSEEGINEPESCIPDISVYKLKNRVRIGIAEDEAFNFYYQENRELLEKMGAELVTFSPLHDEKLPEDIDGIIIGGGYPELYGSALEANVSVRTEISGLIKSGIPIIAECGGYMYLNASVSVPQDNVIAGESEGNDAVSKVSVEKFTKNKSDESKINDVKKINDNAAREELICERTLDRKNSFQMCGVFSGNAVKRERLVRFGYVSAETKSAGLFGPAGTVLKGHEFHRFDCEFNGDGFILTKPKAAGYKTASEKVVRYETGSNHKMKFNNDSVRNTGTYEGVFYGKSMCCGWPHFYYYSNPQAIFNYLKCCERYRIERLAQLKWDNIGKPIDSLGVLEKHVVKLCGIQKTLEPSIDKRALVVLCGDHGCVKEGVTQTDSSVTRKVADSFVKGKTTTAIFAEKNGVDVYTIDVGMVGPRYSEGGAGDTEGKNKYESVKNTEDKSDSEFNHYSERLCRGKINDRRLQDGSGNIAVEPAMSHETGEKALQLGMDIVRELKESGYQIICTGEMGIGNTTPTAALLAYFMGSSAEEAVGYGAGLSEEGLKRKQDVVRRALERLRKESEGQEVLFRIGGLEIAVMAGMFLGGVKYEVPIVIDGIISTAAALTAYMMDERVADYALASHVSKEKLSRKALEKMGLRAIIDAEMSLGEGSGAVLFMPILSSAVEAFNRMGTFSDIKVEAYRRFQ